MASLVIATVLLINKNYSDASALLLAISAMRPMTANVEKLYRWGTKNLRGHLVREALQHATTLPGSWPSTSR
ncbi:hypothetical protein [Streptomyces sp. P9-A4]|uniref:hypothetical protein n=1 Tax=Streptomyces sp. P9-A4 TaxID=3072285 RepID=UPI002FCA894B